MLREQTRLQTDLLRANILSNIKTDNIILDMLLGGIVITLLNNVIQTILKLNIFYKLSKLFHFKWNKKNEILLTRKEYLSTKHWDTKIIYPKSILSIFNYINKNHLVQSGTMKHTDYKIKTNTGVDEINFMIDTKTPIHLKDNIYFEMECSDDGRMIIENNKGEKTIEYVYSLYSYKKSLKELGQFLNDRIEDLDRDLIYSLNKKPVYFIYDKNSEGNYYFDEYPLENDRNFDNIFFDDKDSLKNRIDFFMNNREWYRKKGIPYTLGLMFSGKPGCGKTSTIKAIAKYTNRHIIDIPLNKVENCRDLMNIFHCKEINGKKIPMNKRIYLFEDIDTIIEVLKEREREVNESIIQQVDPNVVTQIQKSPKALVIQNKQNDKLNLGFFLNLIDGVLETPGRILILSTNYPDKLDKALVRPGRIDMKIHLEKCSKKMIGDILEHYYSICMNQNNKIIDLLYDKELTPAELYQFCFKFTSLEQLVDTIENDGIDVVFNKIINREEEAFLEKEKEQLLKQKNTSQNKKRIYKNNIASSESDYSTNLSDNSDSESESDLE